MAGESPDRSKQRASSEEPTPGSAGPVPEARSEADGSAEKRDPRLAVTRESSSSASGKSAEASGASGKSNASGSSGSSGSSARGGVDTATRVLSVGEARDEEDEEPAADVEDSTARRDSPEDADDAGDTRDRDSGDGSDSGADERDGSAAAGDDRLREAVAAWVRTADQDQNQGTSGSGASSEGDDEADGLSAGTAGTSEVSADGEAASPADTDTEADDTDTAGTTGEAVIADTAHAAGTGTGASTQEKPSTTSERSPATESPEPQKPLDGAAADETHADEVSSPEDAPEAATTASTASTPEKTAEAEAEGETDAETDAEADADTREAATGDSDVAPTMPGGGAADSGKADGSKGDGTQGDGTQGDGGKGDDAPAGEERTAPEDTGRETPRSVDQPTAVFRTPRRSTPRVDQPTTMLKLGDAATASADDDGDGKPGEAGKTDKADKAGKTAGAGQVPEGEKDEKGGRDGDRAAGQENASDASDASPADPSAESPAERTSKFVALKPLDDPSTRKPPVTDATTALRTVTPAAAPSEPTSTLPQVGPERTTQQPLPPKPPLDLLAELTNTPPPPETPLRTAVRRVKIWTPLVLLLVIAFAVVQNMRPLPEPTLALTAKDDFTFEGGKVDIPWPADGQAALDVQGIGSFGSSGEQKPVPIASVAKVMTAYVILRDHPLKSGAQGPMIKIDDAAEKQSDAGQESTVDVTAGDEISQREALESILIASANNVARLLARWDAGSEKAFVDKMNAAAEDLGMTNTTYTDPSGLNNTTVSTAVDQVKLGKAAMKQPAFREVAAMMSYDDYKGVNHSNWNQLVGHNNVVGIKTGTTTSALGNLLFAAKKDVDGEMRTIVGAVVRQPAGGKDNTILSAALTAGDELIRAAQGVLESATILKKGEVVGYVDDGLGGRTPVAVTEDVKAVGWAGLSVELTFAADEVPHQAKAGTKVGSLTVGDGTSSAVKVPVALQEDLVEPGFTAKLTRLA